jgi:lysosomal acid lipase/cholesteryl ester hydrolase
MTEDEHFCVGSEEGRLRLRLRHYVGEPHEPAGNGRAQHTVLMLHGGNTSSDTFLLPEGGLARYLRANDCDVWLLDWRASPYVLQDVLRCPALGGSESAERGIYTLDNVVAEDIPVAIARLREMVGADVKLSLLGHCLGGGVLSMAIARGRLAGANIDSVVLSTLGLFYEVPWNGWIKAEDFILERAIQTPGYRYVGPLDVAHWPPAFKSAYDSWPEAWLPPGGSPEEDMLRRLTFMFGQPYATAALHPSIRGQLLLDQFGPMHIGLYLHTSQMVRRGYAARFDAPDVIDRPRGAEARPEDDGPGRGAGARG